jgi:hypothetical protein
MTKITPAILMALLSLTMLTACEEEDEPAKTASAEAPAASAPETETAAPKLHVPDACRILEVEQVAKVSGWKDLKKVLVATDPAYLSACDIVGTDQKHFVKIRIAVGGDEHKDSLEYASIVGDRSGTLRSPAKPITTFGVPVIEMDGGPDMQAMQSRTKPYTELTITTPSMQLTRTLFPQALIALDKQTDKDS